MQKETAPIPQQRSNRIPILSWYCALPYEEKRRVAFVGGGIVIVLFIILNIVMYRSGRLYERNKQQTNNLALAPTATPTPTPLPLICKGMYEFSVSSKSDTLFIKRGVLSPCDPPHDGEQLLQIMTNGNPVSNIQVVLQTDTKKRSVSCIQNDAQKEVWNCKWVMDDSYDYTYSIGIKGELGAKEVMLPMTFR